LTEPELLKSVYISSSAAMVDDTVGIKCEIFIARKFLKRKRMPLLHDFVSELPSFFFRSCPHRAYPAFTSGRRSGRNAGVSLTKLFVTHVASKNKLLRLSKCSVFVSKES
jgi:hypothetical protein